MMTDSAHLHKLQDVQYLYRLSSTFAWDEAIEFCNMSILGIEQAANAATSAAASATNNEAREEYFDEYLDTHFHINQIVPKKLSVREWISYVYKQITFSDQWGNTPLHSASFCKPPVVMIMALFRLARALRRFSWSIIECTLSDGDENNNNNNNDDNVNDDDIYNATNLIIWAATCKDGSTPFLVASSTGASTEVLHCYLDEIQYYMDNIWHNVNHIKEWARKTVIRPDSSGNTPLMSWMAYHNVWIRRQLDPSSRNIRELSRLADYWELTKRMLQFVTRNDLVDSDDSNQQQTTCTLVHQCASISLYCPISLLEWVVSPHRQGIVDLSLQSVTWTPADICAATPDRTTGKLPFHVAMEARPFSFDSTTSVGEAEAVRYTATNPRLEKNRIQMIKKLLTWYPDAATVPFQLMKCANDTTAATVPHSDLSENKIRSRSPFLQAIAFGMTWWHTMNTANCNEEDHNDDYMGLVQLLWRLNAGQITSNRDKVSGLYPFMLAAATATTTADDDCRNDTLLIDTTYNLLKKDPELVTGALITMEK